LNPDLFTAMNRTDATPDPAPKALSVTELTRRIKRLLENEVGSVWVEGELSNVSRPSSGHCYFTVKDETAQISAVLFRGAARQVRFTPADGLRVRCFGEITVYERQGRYQILVRQMEEAGQGALQARFEALKEKLLKEGLFDRARKQPLPLLPLHLGLVTSPTGAAIRDILNVVGRRFPNLRILLAPVKVQGAEAAGEIARAIDRLNAWREPPDVLIVGRGGGSLEDLWAFNEEIVARAIARSRIPIISAVGHEIDFTISDFVADLRAPTPSAAAELVIGRKEDFETLLHDRQRRLAQAVNQSLLRARHRLAAARDHYVFREPANLARQFAQRLDTAELRMRNLLTDRRQNAERTLHDLSLRLTHLVRMRNQAARERLTRLAGQLRALSPMAVLERGYGIVYDPAQHVVTDAARLRRNDPVRIQLAKGEFDARVQ
jgi:exodeoxyribonuclease VII large subunit